MSSNLTLLSKVSLHADLVLANRIAMAPLTRARAGRSQVPNATMAKYYVQRASAGLIISEATVISRRGMGWAGAPAIYEPAHVEGWKAVTSAVHEAGGKIFCQLWHMGRVASSCFHGLQPISASEIPAVGQVTDYDLTKHPYEVPHAATIEEIKEIVNEYRVAAANALEAGFDGVEIHAANGYLLDQFLQSISNTRQDTYGGSIQNRFQLLREVVEACLESFPSHRVAVRLSPNGAFNSMGSADNFEAFSYYISELEKFKLGYLHVMDGLGFGFHNKCPQMRLADVRKIYQGVIMGNCGYDKLTAEGALNTGAVDIIAFGRPFISNPDLVERFANDWQLAPAAPFSVYYSFPNFPDGDGTVGYSDFPTYQEEHNKD